MKKLSTPVIKKCSPTFAKICGPLEIENFQYGSRSSEEFRNLAHDIPLSEFCNGYVISGFSSYTVKLIWVS